MVGQHHKEFCQESKAETLLLLLAFCWLVNTGSLVLELVLPAEASSASGWDCIASVYTP